MIIARPRLSANCCELSRSGGETLDGLAFHFAASSLSLSGLHPEVVGRVGLEILQLDPMSQSTLTPWGFAELRQVVCVGSVVYAAAAAAVCGPGDGRGGAGHSFK